MMTFEEFVEKYDPIEYDGFYFIEGLPYSNIDPHYVWTNVITDGIDELLAGFHMVNRVGYHITRKPWVTGGESVFVYDWNKDEDEDEIAQEGLDETES